MVAHDNINFFKPQVIFDIVWFFVYWNKYIDIAVFAADTKNKEGRGEAHPLYIQKHRLTAGEHSIDIIVTGKPVRVGIDPYLKLIDRTPGDNMKNL